MAENNIKKINIKKKKANRPIYYGVAITTGELLVVKDVARGLACGCVCPSCGTRLEARKGKNRAHHFAHESNKECLYGAEIAIYYAFYKLLKQAKAFFIPDAILKFNSYKRDELIKKGSLIPLSDIEFHNDPVNYPPELLCYSGKNCFQIILNIENYYNEEDYVVLKEYGQQRNIAVVSVDLNDIDSLSTFSDLKQYIDTPNHKTWIFNRLVEDYDKKYRDLAVTPAPFGFGHICLAQKNQYKNVYSALIEDCVSCQYCYDHLREKFCIAPSYIDHIEDFGKPEVERKKDFTIINQLKPIKKISEYRCPECGAPMRRQPGPKGVFAGCSRFPQCRGHRQVEPTTEQVIIFDYRK